MNSNYERNMKLINALVGIILIFFTSSVLATTINGRIVVLNSDSLKFSVLLQINTNTGFDDLGGATMVLRFDTTAIWLTNTPIKDVHYTFHNFNGGNYYPASVTKPQRNRIWVNVDLPYFNNNNGTIIACNPAWTDLVTIHFDVVNLNRTPGLSWLLTSSFWGIYDADNMTLWENGIFDGSFGMTIDIVDGWNMVSVPGINPDGQDVNNWWQGRDPYASVYKMQVGYIPVSTATPGEGYLMKHIGNRTYNTGDEWPEEGIQIVPHEPILVSAGWNLIGGYENIIATNNLTTTPFGLIFGPIYTYAGTYKTATHLEPGRSYLVYLTGAGQINFPDILSKGNGKVIEYFKAHWGKISFTDNTGKHFSLYLVDDETDLNLYALPPVPLEGMFDIRFTSNRIAENIDNGIQTVNLSGISYPVKVKVENISITLLDESRKNINADLKPGDEITITKESIDKLFILSGESVTPKKYSLEQNYPNPFNPSTKIKYVVPTESNVNISLYNVLGELISTLINEEMTPGYYEYELNGSDLASGVYIYRLVAGDFIQSKKMVLLR